MSVYRLTLPWFPRELSTNGQHGHWAPRARATGRYRFTCAMTAREQGLKRQQWGRVAVHLAFYPPDRRRRDSSNCLASVKPLFDALADVLGIDDSRFVITFGMADNIGGMVKVTLAEHIKETA